jgi:hypothetical protein
MLWVDGEALEALRTAVAVAILRTRDARGLMVCRDVRPDAIEHALLGMLTSLCRAPVVKEGTVFGYLPEATTDNPDAAIYTWPPHPVPAKRKF